MQVSVMAMHVTGCLLLEYWRPSTAVTRLGCLALSMMPAMISLAGLSLLLCSAFAG